MINKTKLISIGIALLLCLTGCNKETTSEPAETTADPFETEKAPTEDVTTDCGYFYMDFLKYGSLDTEAVTAEFPDATYTFTDCITAGHTHEEGEVGSGEEMWDYDNGLEDRYTYKRNMCNMYSTYTKTFVLNEVDINKWIDIEVVGLDQLAGSEGTRVSTPGTTWSYEWEAYLEKYILQVYSTGEPGKYIGLVSFTRQGETAINDQFIVDERVEDTAEGGAAE